MAGNYRLMLEGKGLSLWLGGREVKDGDVVSLPLGTFPLLARVKLGRLPPFMKNKKIPLDPHFVAAEDPEKDYADWIQIIKDREPRLQEVIEKVPMAGFASKARFYLKYLETYERENPPQP